MGSGKAVYKKETVTTDVNTGEITHKEEIVIKKEKQAPFIKFYPEGFSVLTQISGGYECIIFYWILERMEYGTNRIALNRSGYREISVYVYLKSGRYVTDQIIKNNIKKLKDRGVLLKEIRGAYIVNPDLCFKGSEREKSKIKEEIRAKK